MTKDIKEMTIVDELRNEISMENTLSLAPWTANPYITAATSSNTRKAYRADIQHFESWGGQLPASSENIVQYLQAFAPHLNPRTLSRRLTALKHWHTYQGFPDPTAHPIVSKTLSGVMRTHGTPRNKALPLLPEQLMVIVQHLLSQSTLRASRNNALLQLGFFGAFRRSELVNIQIEHLQWHDRGIEILIHNSKTDQNHEGRYCAIPNGIEGFCPVQALKKWLKESNIETGFIFRRIVANDNISNDALTPISVNHILKKTATAAGIESGELLSGHSLRRGFATSASRDGASLPAIMRQGRWKNVNTVMEYIEAAGRFEENAADPVLRKLGKDSTKQTE